MRGFNMIILRQSSSVQAIFEMKGFKASFEFLLVKPFVFHLIFGTKKVYVWKSVPDNLFMTLTKAIAVALINKNLLVCMIKWEANHCKTWQIYPPSHGYYLIRLIWWFFFFFFHFFSIFQMCVFKVKYSIGHISGMVAPMDMKRKGSASVGYWVIYVTLPFDIIHDLDL